MGNLDVFNFNNKRPTMGINYKILHVVSPGAHKSPGNGKHSIEERSVTILLTPVSLTTLYIPGQDGVI